MKTKKCENCNFNHNSVCIVKNKDFKPVEIKPNDVCDNHKEKVIRLRDQR